LDGNDAKPPRDRADLRTTHTLLGEAASGNREAIEALCERFRPRLMAWAHGRIGHKYRDLLATDEIVNDALVRSINRLATFKDQREDGFIAYLMTVVTNIIRDEIRRVDRRPGKVEVPDDLASVASTPLDDYVAREDWNLYQQGLSKLSADDRDIIRGRVELGMSMTELAIHTGRSSPAAAGMAFRRATARLAQLMGSTGNGNQPPVVGPKRRPHRAGPPPASPG
jgi:RNA polymerase sigma-70 factor (ECF subfamily)